MSGDVELQGAKEIGQAVLTAALTAAATGLVNWGLERLKDAEKRRRERAGAR